MQQSIHPKFGFVILHYNAIQETIGCIDSIVESLKTGCYYIVVIDNASPNNSVNDLINKYHGNEKIFILKEQINVGFAKGNNWGIDYCRRELKCDFVCCLNNDTLIHQNDFQEIAIQIYKETDAAVIGPLVYLKDGSIQRHSDDLKSELFYKKILKESIEELKHPIVCSLKSKLLSFSCLQKINHLKNTIIRREELSQNDDSYYLEEHSNVVLHGCCLIFTPSFFSKLDGFNPKTFLYCEEQLLYLDLQDNNLISVYSPRISMIHLEDAATNTINKSNSEKRRFVLKNQIESLKILVDRIENSKLR